MAAGKELKSKTKKILKKLEDLFPKAEIALHYSNPWELLVAVMLSAQCTDKKVNEVTKKLFKKYLTLDDYVGAQPSEFEKDIFSTGFYKAKTKHVLATANKVKKEFNGTVPTSMKEMLTLPGVARKTANVTLGNAYGVVEGIAVDTHVKRISKVLGLTQKDKPDKIEQDLMKIIPQKDWLKATYLMIEYGRKYCPARKHEHEKCPLADFHSGWTKN